MANNIQNNPLIIDTAGAGTLISTPFRIKKVRWVGGTTAGHEATITDQNGTVFWTSVAVGVNYVEETDFSTMDRARTVLNGLKVPTLGSGKLYIYE